MIKRVGVHTKIAPFPGAKPNLVAVRAGSKSLHPGWLERSYEDRSFDLIISYFNEDAFTAHAPQDGVQAILIKGGKWDGLYQTFEAFPDYEDYTRIWLPDDDIATTGADIDAMFAAAQTHDLAVCQPALTHDSYYSHFMFLACPGFRLRYTNHIEIMIPCLTGALFAQVLPLFKDTMSGYGLDYIWCRLPGAGHGKAAILDEIAMHHTRPIGSQLRGAIRGAKGERSEDEEARLAARFGGVKKAVPVAYAGLSSEGRKIEGRLAMARAMWRGYGQSWETYLEPERARAKRRQLFKRQIIKPMTLAPLDL